MNAYKKIDKVLNEIYDSPNGVYKDELYKKVINLFEHKDEFDQILRKLEKDKYVDYINITSMGDWMKVYAYFISFDGKLFKEKGGYAYERRRKWYVEFPKNNWLLIAIVAYFIGVFSDIAKEALKRKILPASSQQEQQFQPKKYKEDSVRQIH
ncbi:MAG: hypothetical protein Q8941_24670 [Bacteroidota bacterium]|nr:hypothetical protein [Bacteroidota bacterium]